MVSGVEDSMVEKDKDAAKEALNQLREIHKIRIEHAREVIKTRNRDIKKIKEMLKDSPKTVPEIAAGTKMPSSQVLLYISGLRKYGMVREDEKVDNYFRYALAG